ncbi:MAG: 3-methyl-2-oxobutanoate dehydrogenase subunit beta, partial [Muribaculaceae bacterium]|nr:3-methyl-2-oxobutanoate dehydrogenase subunit beta [Muribaculaceae bacterium]
AFKDRTPAMLLSDGIVGQMMEKVVLPPFRPRRTDAEIAQQCPWAVTGKRGRKERNVSTTLELESRTMEENNRRLQAVYDEIERNEVRFEQYMTDDADYLFVAFGCMSRICKKSIEQARSRGIKVGLLRPITLWPFPTEAIADLSKRVKGILVAEMNAGQMVEDVRLAAEGRTPVAHFGRNGGIVPNPGEVVESLVSQFSIKE